MELAEAVRLKLQTLALSWETGKPRPLNSRVLSDGLYKGGMGWHLRFPQPGKHLHHPQR